MKRRISVITLGVNNLQLAVDFYSAIGFETDGIVGTEFEHGAVAFFQLQNGLTLALWPRTSIAHDTGLTLDAPSATEFTMGHNVSSPAEVDEVMGNALAAGGSIIKAAAETFWGGYAGYFQDPDGHVWEAVWNPSLRVE